ncbi:MAG TPA: hypothetical protein PLR60_03125 [Syntrophorhabdaceae bacterium]|nr:hypothetical protein [Syntrophorhabdaceae bacterium]
MFAIVHWDDPKSARLVIDEEGAVKLFETHAQAENFAEANLIWSWIVLEL